MGFYAWGIFLPLIRGPHYKRYTWFGYEGGLEARKKVVAERQRLEEEKEICFLISIECGNAHDKRHFGMNDFRVETSLL